MVTCTNCGALLREEWDYCGRCGTDRPLEADSHRDAGGLRMAMGETLQRSAATVRRWGALPATVAARLPALPAASGGRRSSSGLTRSLREVRSSPPLLVLLAVLAVLLAFTTLSWLQARSAMQDARGARVLAQAQLDEANTALAGLEAAHQAEVDDLREQLTALETQLAGGSEEVEGLRGQVDAAQLELEEATEELETLQADLEERDTHIEGQQATISTMAECLSGMQVAFAFARSDQQDAAARAYVAVADACDRARDAMP